jgi:hypothetical protein
MSVGGHREDRRQVKALTLPVCHASVGVEHVGAPDGFIDAPETELCQILSDVFGDEAEEVLNEFRLSVEPGPELGILRGHAHWAGVEMTDPHHDAAGHDERRGREAELLGAEQCRDDDVARGAHAAVTLHRDAVA